MEIKNGLEVDRREILEEVKIINNLFPQIKDCFSNYVLLEAIDNLYLKLVSKAGWKNRWYKSYIKFNLIDFYTYPEFCVLVNAYKFKKILEEQKQYYLIRLFHNLEKKTLEVGFKEDYKSLPIRGSNDFILFLKKEGQNYRL